jgi:hypothetical protein
VQELLAAIDWHSKRGLGPLKGQTQLSPSNVLTLAHKFHVDQLARAGRAGELTNERTLPPHVARMRTLTRLRPVCRVADLQVNEQQQEVINAIGQVDADDDLPTVLGQMVRSGCYDVTPQWALQARIVRAALTRAAVCLTSRLRASSNTCQQASGKKLELEDANLMWRMKKRPRDTSRDDSLQLFFGEGRTGRRARRELVMDGAEPGNFSAALDAMRRAAEQHRHHAARGEDEAGGSGADGEDDGGGGDGGAGE